MKILITGILGQLGKALQTALSGHDVSGIDLPEVDITDKEAVFTAVSQNVQQDAFDDVDAFLARFSETLSPAAYRTVEIRGRKVIRSS